jgi:hypothetical protein
LSNNKLTKIDGKTFGAMLKLFWLSLELNQIEFIKNGSFDSIQI